MRRLECLDGLRGLLAVYVLLGHMAPFAPLPGWIQSLVSHGGAAVDVFFVLSGLVIVQSLDTYHGTAVPFLIARVSRIFPAYLLVFTLAIALQPLPCGFSAMPWIDADSPARSICTSGWPTHWGLEILAHMTMTHGLIPVRMLPDVWVSFLGAAWSLSTEWQFYLLALASGSFRHTPAVLIVILFGLTAGGAFLAPTAFSRAFLPYHAHFFALGVASAGVVAGTPGARLRYGLVLALTVAVCGLAGTPGKLLPPLIWTACLVMQMCPDILRFPGGRIARFLGRISYCLYLTNEPVQKVLAGLLGLIADGDPLLFTLLWAPAAIGLPVLVSVLLHHGLELPAQVRGRSVARSFITGSAKRSGQRRFPPL